jgi:Sec-independent protein translocase protein TatA
MEILGVGPSELVFIIIVALIVLGPKDMQKAGKTIGKWMRSIVTSDGWKIFQQTSNELKTLPNRLMRDANEELNQIGNQLNNAANPTVNRFNTPGSSLRSQPTPAILPTPTGMASENKITSPTPVETKTDEGNQDKDA